MILRIARNKNIWLVIALLVATCQSYKLLVYAHDIQNNKKVQYHLLGTIIDEKKQSDLINPSCVRPLPWKLVCQNRENLFLWLPDQKMPTKFGEIVPWSV